MPGMLLSTGAVENAVAPGTGTVTLNGPVSGNFRRFRDDPRAQSGRQYAYAITDGNQREWGIGTLTIGQNGAADTLTRDTVLEASGGGTAKLNFTGAVVVYSAAHSASMATRDAAGALYAGLNNDDKVKTEGTFPADFATLPDVDGYRTTAQAVTNFDFTMVATRLRLQFKAAVAFASAYTPQSGDGAEVTTVLQIFQIDANGAMSGNILAQCYDVVSIQAGGGYGKTICFALAKNLTVGTRYRGYVYSYRSGKAGNNDPAVRLSTCAAEWMQF
jgi:hypothetical protein